MKQIAIETKTPTSGEFPFMKDETGGGKESKDAIAGNIKKQVKKLRKSILAEFDIEDKAGLEILERALESFRRMREAEAIIKEEGLTTVNRFGELKSHPCVDVERKARAAFLLALKQLNLDILPPNHRIGRPGGR